MAAWKLQTPIGHQINIQPPRRAVQSNKVYPAAYESSAICKHRLAADKRCSLYGLAMGLVYVFVANGRFSSLQAMREFIDERYTEDGDGLPSDFMRETGLGNYEPMCIEAILSPSGKPVPLKELLAASSWSSQWLGSLDIEKCADSAICVFSPNTLRTPRSASVEYLGAFCYDAA